MTNAVSIAQSGSNNVTMRNRIINGAMTFNQRAFSGSPPNGDYTLDRWQGLSTIASKFTISQSSDAPAGFVNSLLATSSSAYSVGSSERFGFRQFIEGYNWADLNWGSVNGKAVTLSFWVKSSLTGSFGGAIQNNNDGSAYPYSYTISAANTWEYKTVTIPAIPNGVSVASTTAAAIAVFFSLGVGTGLQGPANTWAVGVGYQAPTGSVSVVGTNAATLLVTGVQIESGTAASPFENRLYGTELSLCQRYYFGDFESTGGVCYSSAQAVFMPRFPVPMRTAPTFSFKSGSTSNIDIYGVGTVARSLSFSDSFTAYACRLSYNISAGSMGNFCQIANNLIQVSAEL